MAQLPNKGAVGSYVNHNYVRRDVTVFGIMDSELDNIGTWNKFSSLMFALTGAGLSAAATLYFESHLSPEMTPAGEVLVVVGAPLCLAIGVGCLGLGIIFQWKRGSVLNRIKKESKEVPNPAVNT